MVIAYGNYCKWKEFSELCLVFLMGSRSRLKEFKGQKCCVLQLKETVGNLMLFHSSSILHCLSHLH